MKPILTSMEAKMLDRGLIEECGLSESALIDQAALLAYKCVRENLKGRLVFLIGCGNNGADGLEFARLAEEDGFDVSVVFLKEKGSAENEKRRLSSLKIVEDAKNADTVIDALFGFGFHGSADSKTIDLIASIPKTAFVISLDVPSCALVDADITVMMTTPKLSLFLPARRHKGGRLFCINPGFPPERLRESPGKIYLLEDGDEKMRQLSLSDYKNSKGHLLAIGGSERYCGAIRLSSRAAFAAGVGLVSLIASVSIREECPSMMIADKDTDFTSYDAVLIGPGWDKGDETLFERAVDSGKNMVIDADGLKFVPDRFFSFRAVITPHIGEYRRLMASLSLPDGLDDEEHLSSSLKTLSLRIGAIVVLKSSVIWITDGDSIYIYDGVNPSMGIAGSGDVLSGVIAALLAEGEDPLRAAIDGVILHQRAGFNAHKRLGYYSSEDLIIEVGRAR